jgi:transcriptional regulator with XRE-family HTH domain
MKLPGDRVVEIRKNTGLSQKEFAQQIGITQGALSHIETNRTKLSVDIVTYLCRHYHINSEWLLFNRGPMHRSHLEKAYASSVPHENDNRIILIKEDAHADYPSKYNDEQYLTGLGSYRVPGFDNGTFRMFEISGNSMEPTLYTKEIVITERVDTLNRVNSNHIYIVITDKGVLAKRVFVHENGSDIYILKSDNPTYQEFSLRAKDIYELWEVKAKLTKEFLQLNPDKVQSFSALEERIKSLENLFRKSIQGTKEDNQ